MNIYLYVLITYGITAVISYLVIALVVLINRIMSRVEKVGGEA